MYLNSDILSEQSVKRYAGKERYDIKIFQTADSTNNIAQKFAEKGALERTVIIADAQTGGIGRMGRKFCSPAGTGLYMSIILRPNIFAAESVFITAAAAVAVARATEDVSGYKTEIKWVNDVYCRGKKICGILTQGAVNARTGFFDYAVLGIGVNVTEPKDGFPAEIADRAGALLKVGDNVNDARNRIAAKILNYFFQYYADIKNKSFMREYKERSFVIGQNINVIKPDVVLPATAIDIDDECRLIVKYENNTAESLISGEISVRWNGDKA